MVEDKRTMEQEEWVDQAEFDQAEEMARKGVRHLEYKDSDGMCRYEGDLGSFTYDPKQFQVQKIKIPGKDGSSASVEVLRYIGQETDGSKIQIPEGVENGQLMFMNTNIKSAPQLPKSLKRSNAMFQGCSQLEVANVNFPPQLESASFMFANCGNLKQGPVVIPGTVKNANMMFVNNTKLENTPRLGDGIKSGEMMFANCKSLTDFPNVPKSMSEYQHMTFGCEKLDQRKDAKAQEKLEKDREKFVKKMDQPTFRQRCGSAFSAMMQVHALRQAGWGIMEAPFLVHQYRKNGTFSKDFAGGLSALAMSGKSGTMMNMMAARSVQKAQKRNAKMAAQKAAQLEKWDKAHGYGMGTTKDMKMVSQASKDVERGFFTKLPMVSAEERQVYAERFNMSAKIREDVLNQTNNLMHGMSSKDKQMYAKMYQKDLSAVAVYYQEGQAAIERSNLSKSDKLLAMEGLKQMSAMQAEPLMASIERVQAQYKIFNDGDLRQMGKLAEVLPSEQAKKKSFMDRMSPHASKQSYYQQAMRTFDFLNEQMNPSQPSGPSYGG